MVNVIYIEGTVGEDFFGAGNTLQSVRNQYQESASSVEVHINSPGGDADTGMAIYDFLKGLSQPVTTIATGSCYSMGSVIFCAGSKRLMQPNAEIMIHNPWTQPPAADAEQLQVYVDWLEQTEDKIIQIYRDATGLKKSEIRDLMDSTTFMNYDVAKEKGFATGTAEKMKAVAYYNPKNKKMTDFTPEQKATFKEMFNSLADNIKAIFKPVVKNQLIETDDTKFFAEGEGDLKGKKVFQSDDKGEITDKVLADGDYVAKDGKTITVKDGLISEVKEKQTDEIETLRAEIEQLKADKEAADQKATEKEAELQAVNAEVGKIQAKFETINQMVFGTEPPAKPPKQRASADLDEVDEMLIGFAKRINDN